MCNIYEPMYTASKICFHFIARFVFVYWSVVYIWTCHPRCVKYLTDFCFTAMTSEITNVETSSKKDDMVDMKEGSTAESSSQENSTPQPTGEELTRQLKNQLEYYFSRSGLISVIYFVLQVLLELRNLE